MKSHLINDFGIAPVIEYNELYVKQDGRRVAGNCGSYVDDALNTGVAKFQKLIEQTLKQFESKSRVYNLLIFYQTQIKMSESEEFKLSQKYYVSIL